MHRARTEELSGLAVGVLQRVEQRVLASDVVSGDAEQGVDGVQGRQGVLPARAALRPDGRLRRPDGRARLPRPRPRQGRLLPLRRLVQVDRQQTRLRRQRRLRRPLRRTVLRQCKTQFLSILA